MQYQVSSSYSYFSNTSALRQVGFRTFQLQDMFVLDTSALQHFGTNIVK